MYYIGLLYPQRQIDSAKCVHAGNLSEDQRERPRRLHVVRVDRERESIGLNRLSSLDPTSSFAENTGAVVKPVLVLLSGLNCEQPLQTRTLHCVAPLGKLRCSRPFIRARRVTSLHADCRYLSK